MIYVCIPSRDEAKTLGLLLWKVRKIFAELEREYQLLVVDDGSTDDTASILPNYERALPLTVLREATPAGMPRAVTRRLGEALARTDRPRRDCAIVLHADFRHDPAIIPMLVKQIDSGADLVVAEGTPEAGSPRGYRFLRRLAPWILRGRGRIPGIRDTVSGCYAARLVTVREAMQHLVGDWIATDGWAANAEMVARLAAHSRRVVGVPMQERQDWQQRPSRIRPWEEARRLWAAAGQIPPVPTTSSPVTTSDTTAPDSDAELEDRPGRKRRRRRRRPARRSATA